MAEKPYFGKDSGFEPCESERQCRGRCEQYEYRIAQLKEELEELRGAEQEARELATFEAKRADEKNQELICTRAKLRANNMDEMLREVKASQEGIATLVGEFVDMVTSPDEEKS
jgi:hypothetical protein